MNIRSAAALSCVLLALSLSAPALAQSREGLCRKGVRLYEKGLYERAAQVFDQVAPGDAISEGYRVLCAGQTGEEDFDDRLYAYEHLYGETALSPRINFLYGLNLFDEGRYDEALYRLGMVPERSVSYRQYTELLFKTAYSRSSIEDYDGAEPLFDKVIERRKSPFTAPSWYAKGYLMYRRGDFAGAYDAFARSAQDSRFATQASYYMLECRFMQKDYAYVTEHASEIYSDAPQERRQHLARIISESYLVRGDAAEAERYYQSAVEGSAGMNRADWFYAGSLQYALGHYREAIDNFSRMTERTDSTGQIASYQMGYSYIQVKDKVSAMQAFREASELPFDAGIREDAMLNHAKLAFDLNQDASVFERYLAAYPDAGKHDMIYDYMAVASLYKRDYAAAIDAYDHIDELTPEMKGNYMRANYLRAEQLVAGGSWSEARAPLKAAAAYSARTSTVNRLARYWQAESAFNTDDYDGAAGIYTDLYNTSSLDRRAEGRLLPYNIAYCHYNTGDFQNAAVWFDKYVATGDGYARQDALVRRADCDFYRQQYKDAAAAYAAAISQYPDINNIYPYYQQGLAYGFAGSVADKAASLSRVLGADASAPMYAEAVYELGRTYVSLGRESDAVNAFNTVIKRSSDSTYVARSLIGIGMIERNAGRYDAALDSYKQVVERYPGGENAEAALLAIESIYQSRGEPEKYFAYVERIGRPSASDEEKEAVMFNSAEQIFLTENYDRAISTLTKYMDMYPGGAYTPRACYYMAESYKALGQKEKACGWYARAVESGAEGELLTGSLLGTGALSASLERHADAYAAYSRLHGVASDRAMRLTAAQGMMQSAYALHRYDDAEAAADMVLGDSAAPADALRAARYLKARSMLSTSRRDEAYELFSVLAGEPSTAEGAEASYLIIQDVYDRGRFDDVEKLVYEFADKAAGQSYWLARAFVVLGDAFMENGNVRQARATFESVRDGYVPRDASDDVPEAVRMRLSKLDQMQ